MPDREARVHHKGYIKLIYSEKVTKFCEISIVDLSVTTQDKSTVEIPQKIVTFSEYMKFNKVIKIEFGKLETILSPISNISRGYATSTANQSESWIS